LGMEQKNNENISDPNREIVLDESAALLSNENIVTALKKYTPNTREKELAVEFVSSYSQFIQELTKHDLNKKIGRSDVEIQDLISHVNMMLKKKNDYLFTMMVMKSPLHYRNIQKSLIQKDADEVKS